MLGRKRCLPSQPADQLWSGAVRHRHAWFYTSQRQCKLVSCTDLAVLFACDKVAWERLLSNLVPLPGSLAAAWSKEASECLGACLPWSAVEQVVPGPPPPPCLTIPMGLLARRCSALLHTAVCWATCSLAPGPRKQILPVELGHWRFVKSPPPPQGNPTVHPRSSASALPAGASPALCSHLGLVLPPGDIRHVWRHFGLSQPGEGACCWHLVGGGQGAYSTDSPHHKGHPDKTSVVPSLRHGP